MSTWKNVHDELPVVGEVYWMAYRYADDQPYTIDLERAEHETDDYYVDDCLAMKAELPTPPLNAHGVIWNI